MSRRIFITGAAGLVGQNLVAHLKQSADLEITCVDKHPHNSRILKSLHPEIRLIEADCAEPGDWQSGVVDCDQLVMLHAQIGGLDPKEFERNNVTATRLVLDTAQKAGVKHLVHVSSSVINSSARDFYVESKTRQEALVQKSSIPHVVLRPTLMFGWFDRKHLGWLMRFLRRAPLFPIPGSGKYLRQPLFVGDFCSIVASCLQRRTEGEYNISGLTKIDYIDLIEEVRRASGARTPIIRIPYSVFWLLLSAYALFERDPPFTTLQLKALTTPDVFEVIDWPAIFGVTATPLREALARTFNDPQFSNVVLEF